MGVVRPTGRKGLFGRLGRNGIRPRGGPRRLAHLMKIRKGRWRGRGKGGGATP